MVFYLLMLLRLCSAGGAGVEPVYQLLDRILPGSHSHFDLSLGTCGQPPCFQIADGSDSVKIVATNTSELSAAVGVYLREVCNLTIGWPRGGGSNLVPPAHWPTVGAPIERRRIVPHSYMMNVCTHSYSLVWYDWPAWEAFIDWMALSGLNLVLAMTGQEEVQYKVFEHFGLNDTEIRHWFNGPAFLTWSRGQNEYGNNIAGPLPRSWMKAQWQLQKDILKRYRELGIVGQLPGFQGNVPIGLKELHNDKNITKQGATGWMDSLDPLFGQIADVWMRTLIEDFGTDHWYQLDGYFNGGTAPWYYEGGTVAEPRGEDVIGDEVDVDVMSYKRGAMAYQGLNRTDADAIWSFQGWAFIGWKTAQQASFIKGFVESANGNFVVIDMSTNGEGEWKKWNNASFFGAKFIWTTLHDFGGTDGMKGDLDRINHIPFEGMAPNTPTSVWGTGFTPEGIDQNPVYYEFMLEANMRSEPVADITSHIQLRSHRRYGLTTRLEAVDKAWALLVQSTYANDLSVQDGTGIPHLPGHYSEFEKDRKTPTAELCQVYEAWGYMLDAASTVAPDLIPFQYDLVNLGRELLAQLSVPMSMNYSDALHASKLDAARLVTTGDLYVQLLVDTDTLVGTTSAFLLGPWIDSARQWGAASDDCANDYVSDCPHFYEWNARVQLTTWNPTPKNASKIPGGPNDYASKHWNGLIKDYYAKRALLLQAQALKFAAAGKPFDDVTYNKILAEHAYAWTIAQNPYPVRPVGKAVDVSQQMHDKYGAYFAAC